MQTFDPFLPERGPFGGRGAVCISGGTPAYLYNAETSCGKATDAVGQAQLRRWLTRVGTGAQHLQTGTAGVNRLPRLFALTAVCGCSGPSTPS